MVLCERIERISIRSFSLAFRQFIPRIYALKVGYTNDNLQMVLRICTSKDMKGYKNSIISSWRISEKRLQNYLRNKRILYKKQ